MDEKYRRHVPAIPFALALLVAGFTGCSKQEFDQAGAGRSRHHWPAAGEIQPCKRHRRCGPCPVPAGATKPVNAKGTVGQPLAGLPPGKYTVIVHTDGWPDLSQEADVAPGQVTEVSADFKSGSLRVDSDPAGAAVRIGTEVLGRTLLAVPQLPAGRLPARRGIPRMAGAVTIKTTIVENQEAAHSVRLPHGARSSSRAIPRARGRDGSGGGRSLGQTPLTLESVAAETEEVHPAGEGLSPAGGGGHRGRRRRSEGQPVAGLRVIPWSTRPLYWPPFGWMRPRRIPNDSRRHSPTPPAIARKTASSRT